ncbi:MAG: hypothetical protein AB7E05_04425 [Sphingobium sp.]
MNRYQHITSAPVAESSARKRDQSGGKLPGIMPFPSPRQPLSPPPPASAHGPLFEALLHHAADQASAMTTALRQGRLIDSIADDGVSMTERLEHSPFADDQLLAVALRLRMGLSRCEEIAGALLDHFRHPLSSLAIEAQRRAVMAAIGGNGLPTGAATEAAARIERQEAATAAKEDGSARLASHAALYADLWCDPRIGATIGARQTMLAMVTALQDRSLALHAPAKIPLRRRK